jgi:GT2 family glycosyltransferase
MARQPSVLIVTVNYNSRDNTLQTLAALAQMTYPRFEILLVDNGSSDDSLTAIRRAFPALSVIANETNLGFAGGFNLGLQRGIAQGADLILAINNDVVVAPDMLDHLVAACAPKVGAVGPRIYYYDKPDCIWSSGFRRHPVTLEMVRGQRNQVVHAAQFAAPFPVDYLLGCAMLLNREALVTTGLFDPRFYLYYEDLDLSLRLQGGGYRLWTVPAASMWHKVAGSSGLTAPLRTYHLARSSVLFFRKHGGGWRAPFVWAYRTGSAIRKIGTFLSHRDTRSARAYLQGLRDGWSGACNDAPYR